jgi:DNA-binding beta-propeller fold protein YncE
LRRIRILEGIAAGLAVWLAFTTLAAAQPRHQLRSPNRIALLPSGQLAVSDHRLKGVAIWHPRRAKMFRLVDVPGRAMGLAAGWGRLFVGNAMTASVDVFTPSGQLRYLLGSGDGQVGRPSDIAVDIDEGLVFVSDSKGSQVLVFDYRGPLANTIPSPGQVPLFKPTGVAVDPARQEVLVSDYGTAGWFSSKAYLKIYDYAGNHRATLHGSRVDPEFRFSRPQGIAVNGQGLIYLVDSLRGQVLVFDRDTLQGVEVIGELGRLHGQLKLPLDAAINLRTGDLYVSDNHNARIEVFAGKGKLP